MKYVLYYCLLIIILILIIPLIIIKGCGGLKKDLLDDKKGKIIKVFFHRTNEIKEVGFEDYIRGVVAAEMPASYNIEALKAQAVAARTYAFNKIYGKSSPDPAHPGADVCTDSAHCQAWISRDEALNNWPDSKRGTYWDKISWAVRSTAGELIYFEDQIANPVFHANSGGRTENTENVWVGRPVPYLKGVDSPGEDNSSSYLSQAEFVVGRLVEKLKKAYPDFQIDEKNLKNSIKITERNANDRVGTMVIGNKTLKGTEVRKILDLKSTNFTFEVSENKVIFKVKGYGHGVGMSQCGANYQAQQGKNYKEILKYYYEGVEIY